MVHNFVNLKTVLVTASLVIVTMLGGINHVVASTNLPVLENSMGWSMGAWFAAGLALALIGFKLKS